VHPLQIAASALPSVAATASAVSSVATGPVSEVATAVGSFITTTVPSIVASILPPGATTQSAAAVLTPIKLVAPQYEVAATFVGAVSGSLIAVRKRFDIMGVLTIAIVNGLGGGIIRDVLLQKYGIAAFQHQYLLWTALFAGLIGFFFAELIRRGRLMFMVVDSLSLGLFAIIGSDKALAGQLGIVPVILLGVITATGGGILRDVLTGEVPQALQPGSMYAFAATVGTSAFVLMLVWLGLVKPIAAFIAVSIIMGLRLLSIVLGWQTPTPVDLTPWIARAVPASVRQVAGRLGRNLPDLPEDPRKPLPPMYGRRARARRAQPPDRPDDDASDSTKPGSGKD
jgi:uncharacterized membrane protein YeiH